MNRRIATPLEKMAKCRCYEAEDGSFGQMTIDGKTLTPPAYSSIRAIGYELYLCKENYDGGVLLNGKAERIG